MQLTAEILTSNRDALVKERDGYLAEAARLRDQATAVNGAIRICEHLLGLIEQPEQETE